MKKFKYLFALLFCTLCYYSCQKEQELGLQLKPDTEAVAQSLFAELSIATDELRLAHEIDPVTGHTIRPQLSDKDLSIRVCVRREQGGTAQHQTLRFIKQAGDQSVSYRGNIQVPTDGTGGYLLSAIVLGEEGGDTYARLSGNDVEVLPATELALAEGTLLKTNVPYVVKDEPIYIAQGGSSITPIALTFKPSGTLLRMQLSNATNTEQTFTAITLKSNAFFPTWSYDLSGREASNLRAGYRASLDAWEQRYPIAPITLAAGATAKQYYYVWVMPRSTESSDVKTEVFVENSVGESLFAASRSAIPKEGGLRFALQVGKQTLPIPTDVNSTVAPSFPSGKFPWERFAGVFVWGDQDEHGFHPVVLPTETVPNGKGVRDGGLYTRYPYESDYRLLEEKTLYKVPTQAELTALLPNIDYSITHSRGNDHDYRLKTVIFYPQMSGVKKIIERVCFSDEDYFLSSEYIGVEAEKTIYAIRFSGWNNGMRMAYRYQWGGEHAYRKISRLVISMKFIGNDPSYNIQTLPQKGEVFWADSHKVYLPLFTDWGGYNASHWQDSFIKTTRYVVSNPGTYNGDHRGPNRHEFDGVYVNENRILGEPLDGQGSLMKAITAVFWK